MKSVTAVKKLYPANWWTSASKPRLQVSTPLLTRNEILRLRQQVEQQNRSFDYRHEVEHRTLGDARSVYRGYGMDYDESRPYYPGDELRFMNWRVTARTGKPHMKVFREERKPGVFIVVDRRQDMRFGTRTRLKVTQAVRAATIIAFDARLRNAPVSGVLLESSTKNKLTWLAETFDEAGVFNFIHNATKPCPPPGSMKIPSTSKGKNEQTFSRLIKMMAPMLTRGSNVVLISDFHDLDDTCRPNLLELSMTHHLQAVRIADPIELSLPDCGNLLVQAERHTAIGINSSSTQTSSRYKESASHFLGSKQQLFRSLAIPCQTIMTDDDDITRIVET